MNKFYKLFPHYTETDFYLIAFQKLVVYLIKNFRLFKNRDFAVIVELQQINFENHPRKN